MDLYRGVCVTAIRYSAKKPSSDPMYQPLRETNGSVTLWARQSWFVLAKAKVFNRTTGLKLRYKTEIRGWWEFFCLVPAFSIGLIVFAREEQTNISTFSHGFTRTKNRELEVRNCKIAALIYCQLTAIAGSHFLSSRWTDHPNWNYHAD